MKKISFKLLKSICVPRISEFVWFGVVWAIFYLTKGEKEKVRAFATTWDGQSLFEIFVKKAISKVSCQYWIDIR